ncbi:MAG: hypothetical protein HC859_01940 [Bacteroidia bacterium]|nr:hypothetical protein [Bacteroidia bacterium]
MATGQRDDDDTAPKGFLNILVLDKKFNMVDLAYQQVSAAYAQSGETKMPHERLAKELVIRQPGYVFIFPTNEGQFEQQIGFDASSNSPTPTAR